MLLRIPPFWLLSICILLFLRCWLLCSFHKAILINCELILLNFESFLLPRKGILVFQLFFVSFSTQIDLSLASASLYFVLHATRLSAWINLSFSRVEDESSFEDTAFSNKSRACRLTLFDFPFSINMSSFSDWSNASFSIFSRENSFSPRLLLLAPPLSGVSTLQVLCELLRFYPLMPLIVLHVPPLESSAYSSILLVYDMILDVLSLLVWYISL